MPGQHRPFLTATWRNPVLLTYEIDPEAVREYLPQGLSLDYWQGKCLISLVGLHFLNARILGWPVPFFGSYPEINLRFYVRRELPGELRRGAVFIKQIVPFRAVALTARLLYREQFMAMPVKLILEGSSNNPQQKRVTYQWRHRGFWSEMGVQPDETLDFPEPGSLEEFVAERYWGYNMQPDSTTLEFHIERPRWRIRRAVSDNLKCDAASLYGEKFAEALEGTPVSAFWAEGSEVSVYRGIRLYESQV